MPSTSGLTKKSYSRKWDIVLSDSSYYICSVCQRRFISLQQLRRHKEVHSLKRRFPCEQCGKRFLQRAHHLLHQRVHTGERPFECSQCSRPFSAKHNLTRHMTVHAREETRRCKDRGEPYCQRRDHLTSDQSPKSEPGSEVGCSPSSSPAAISPSSSNSQIQTTSSSSLSTSTFEDAAPPHTEVSSHVLPAPNPTQTPRCRGRPPKISRRLSCTLPSDPEESASETRAPSVQVLKVSPKKEDPSSPQAGIPCPVEIPITLSSFFFEVTRNPRRTNDLWFKSDSIKTEQNVVKEEKSERASPEAVAYDVEVIL